MLLMYLYFVSAKRQLWFFIDSIDLWTNDDIVSNFRHILRMEILMWYVTSLLHSLYMLDL